jgi:hypothetical protein
MLWFLNINFNLKLPAIRPKKGSIEKKIEIKGLKKTKKNIIKIKKKRDGKAPLFMVIF